MKFSTLSNTIVPVTPATPDSFQSASQTIVPETFHETITVTTTLISCDNDGKDSSSSTTTHSLPTSVSIGSVTVQSPSVTTSLSSNRISSSPLQPTTFNTSYVPPSTSTSTSSSSRSLSPSTVLPPSTSDSSSLSVTTSLIAEPTPPVLPPTGIWQPPTTSLTLTPPQSPSDTSVHPSKEATTARSAPQVPATPHSTSSPSQKSPIIVHSTGPSDTTTGASSSSSLFEQTSTPHNPDSPSTYSNQPTTLPPSATRSLPPTSSTISTSSSISQPPLSASSRSSTERQSCIHIGIGRFCPDTIVSDTRNLVTAAATISPLVITTTTEVTVPSSSSSFSSTATFPISAAHQVQPSVSDVQSLFTSSSMIAHEIDTTDMSTMQTDVQAMKDNSSTIIVTTEFNPNPPFRLSFPFPYIAITTPIATSASPISPTSIINSPSTTSTSISILPRAKLPTFDSNKLKSETPLLTDFVAALIVLFILYHLYRWRERNLQQEWERRLGVWARREGIFRQE